MPRIASILLIGGLSAVLGCAVLVRSAVGADSLLQNWGVIPTAAPVQPAAAAIPVPATPSLAAPAAPQSSPGQSVVVRLPNPVTTADGQLLVQPNIGGDGMPMEALPSPDGGPMFGMPDFSLPLLNDPSVDPNGEDSYPVFHQFLEHFRDQICRNQEPGIGRERLVYAPTLLEITQPQDNYRMRMDSVYGLDLPDRSEYFWSRTPRGPAAPETSVDYQDFKFYLEEGGPKFSLATEIPIRLLNPDLNNNTAGMGDMTVTQKTVMVDGKEWQMTQYFKSYLPTGSSLKGLGTGHVSLEPGWLVRYRYTDRVAFHGQVMYLFPLGGDPNFAGEVLRWGLGWSHVLREGDTFAILDTAEFQSLTFMDGRATLPNGLIREISGENMMQIALGLRFVRDTGGDLGLMEYGVAGIHQLGWDGYFDTGFRMDVRWIY